MWVCEAKQQLLARWHGWLTRQRTNERTNERTNCGHFRPVPLASLHFAPPSINYVTPLSLDHSLTGSLTRSLGRKTNGDGGSALLRKGTMSANGWNATVNCVREMPKRAEKERSGGTKAGRGKERPCDPRIAEVFRERVRVLSLGLFWLRRFFCRVFPCGLACAWGGLWTN